MDNMENWQQPYMLGAIAFTENSSPTFSTSGDARVDFFFHITEDANADKTLSLVSKSWSCEPLDTLKLVAYLRDIRSGKGIRLQYQICLLWLYNNHRNTLYNNLETLVSFGYWKDLLHLLMTLIFNGHIPHYLDETNKSKQVDVSNESKVEEKNKFPMYDRLVLRNLRKYRKAGLKEKKLALKDVNASSNNATNIKKVCKGHIIYKRKSDKTRAQLMQESREAFAKFRYDEDENYRKFFDKIVELFAQQLKIDIEKMKKGIKAISLAGKWIPSIGKHFDKYLSISSAIAIELSKIMNKMEIQENPDLIKSFYRKEVCSVLRNYLKIPEVYMSSNKWAEIEYNRVASKSMQKNKSAFIKHDKERFEAYLKSKKTIAGATLKPIEIVERGMRLLNKEQMLKLNSEEILELSSDEMLEIEVLEKQWLSLCEDIQKKGGGLLKNAIAICDVSGSMNGQPMSAAIGLTILTMQLSSPPWDSLCITFHSTPNFHSIEPEQGFMSKLGSLQSMPWGYNTNFNAVFDLIIEKAVTHRLTAEQMPKLLFVFTDMEFDSAFPETTKTNYEVAAQTFNDAGYAMPAIAFWNLRSDKESMSTPVQVSELGTLLLSGYSGQQLALVLKNEDFSKLTPMGFMRQAIDSKRYDALKVYD